MESLQEHLVSFAHTNASASTARFNQNAMDNFINTQLHPVDACIVCTEPFSTTHQPVTLPCKHIFGHECIKKWLRSGRGNTSSCPNCRHVIFEKKNPKAAFDAPSIWKALCDQPPERLHAFMGKIWDGLDLAGGRGPEGA